MKTSISKEVFIRRFECLIGVMSDFVCEGKKSCFYTCQSGFSSLLHFAYINDILSDDEYRHYKTYDFCQFDDFAVEQK